MGGCAKNVPQLSGNVLPLSYVWWNSRDVLPVVVVVVGMLLCYDGDGILILRKACIERCYGCLSETFRFKMFLIISDKHALNKVNVIKMVA